MLFGVILLNNSEHNFFEQPQFNDKWYFLNRKHIIVFGHLRACYILITNHWKSKRKQTEQIHYSMNVHVIRAIYIKYSFFYIFTIKIKK